jgi:hypothetical protein
VAYSNVQIANLALSHAKSRGEIASLTESSREAKICRQHFDVARDEMLRAHDWGFARRYIALAARSGETLPPGWLHAYGYPSDCLAARRLLRPEQLSSEGATYWSSQDERLQRSHRDEAERFEVASDDAKTGRLIFCNIAQPWLRYTATVTTPAVFDPLFVAAMALHLGGLISPGLHGNDDHSKVLLQRAAAKVSEAEAADANEVASESGRDAEWVRGRW